MDNNSLIKVGLFGGAAVAGYFFFIAVPSGVPTQGVWNGFKPTGGGSRISPTTGDTWVDGGGHVVAAFNNGKWQPVNSPTTPASPATPPVTPGASAPLEDAHVLPATPPHRFLMRVQPATPAATLGLTALFNAMTSKAHDAGVASTGPDGWNFYLVAAGGPSPAPDPLLVFPGVDRSTPMTANQYWAGMAPYLKTSLGMSGLGAYAALAGLARGRR